MAKKRLAVWREADERLTRHALNEIGKKELGDFFERVRESGGECARQVLLQHDADPLAKDWAGWRRALVNADALDLMDFVIGSLEEEAQFQDINPLVRALAPVIEALEDHAEMAEPRFFEDSPMYALASAVFRALSIGNKMGPRIEGWKRMAHRRGKKAAKARSRDVIIEARAAQFRKLDPERSIHDMALEIGPQVDLKTNTVEKKIARLWNSRQKSTAAKKIAWISN
jgi:hypothetical protein